MQAYSDNWGAPADFKSILEQISSDDIMFVYEGVSQLRNALSVAQESTLSRFPLDSYCGRLVHVIKQPSIMDISNEIKRKLPTHQYSLFRYGDLVHHLSNGHFPFARKSFCPTWCRAGSLRNDGVEYGLRRFGRAVHQVLRKSELGKPERNPQIRHFAALTKHDRLFRQIYTNKNPAAAAECQCTFRIRF